jgi:hypothetical protein
MAKITPRTTDSTISVRTMTNSKKETPGDWWNANSKKEMSEKLLATAGFLKEVNQFRFRQAAIYSRLYGNIPLGGIAGTNFTAMAPKNNLPLDRPTFPVITSCVDTLVSRISQSRPNPIFLTDDGDYKKRTLAKQMNTFISGEFYQTKAYELAPLVLRDACVLGTGVIKILEDQEKRVSFERRLCTELLVDPNDSYYGFPRQLYELKLIDRNVLAQTFPKYRSDIEKADQAYPDQTGEGMKTVSDLIMMVEGWHLPSGPDATDGIHTISCSEGVVFEEKWDHNYFPFAFLHYSPNISGFWGRGVPEKQMGTQFEINKLLITISTAINLVGIPRVFIEDGSKVVKAHLNNSVGSIVTYRGTKPIYEVAPCVPAELYEHLQRLINYVYQSEGISQLAASSQKPSGLTSGEALRAYEDNQTDRFADLSKRYDNFFVDLAYQTIWKATEIAKRDGKYETIYPNKDGAKQIDLPDAKQLEDPFVIQCHDSSSLPKDPSGRLQKVTEMMQSGLITPQEGRRLLDFADIQQVDKLAIAGEERILKILDEIVEDGKYTPPDPFMDLNLASQLVNQYYNLYTSLKLSESRSQLLRNFYSQILALQQQAMPPPPSVPQPQGGGLSPPMANPQPLPQNDLLPNVPRAS